MISHELNTFVCLLGLGLLKEDDLQFLNVCPFDYKAVAESVNVGSTIPIE